MSTQEQSAPNSLLGIGVGMEEPAPERPKTPFWDVYFLNDDGTPFDFVIDVLQIVFAYSQGNAEVLVMTIHRDGEGKVGTFFKEAAEVHQGKVHTLAAQQGFPLRCVLRPAGAPPTGLTRSLNTGHI